MKYLLFLILFGLNNNVEYIKEKYVDVIEHNKVYNPITGQLTYNQLIYWEYYDLPGILYDDFHVSDYHIYNGSKLVRIDMSDYFYKFRLEVNDRIFIITTRKYIETKTFYDRERQDAAKMEYSLRRRFLKL